MQWIFTCKYKVIMSLGHKFRQAERILSTLAPADKKELEKVCREIRAAELELHEKSGRLMRRCVEQCRGACCRNLEVDSIVTRWDFLFILVSCPDFKENILRCLKEENLFFPADCIFLENGTGPCIFPSNVRPEVCLVSFCDDTALIRKEIRGVRRKFFALTWLVISKKPGLFLSF
ncbi:MAG: hypothetical protein R6U97_12125 [Desulfosalsimonas sp.]